MQLLQGIGPFLSGLKNLGFSSLLGSGILTAAYWVCLGFWGLDMDLKTQDVILVGALIGLGLDVYTRSTVIGQMTTMVFNIFLVKLMYYPLRFISDSEMADSLRDTALQRIRTAFLSGDLPQLHDLTSSILSLRTNVDYLLGEVAELDGRQGGSERRFIDLELILNDLDEKSSVLRNEVQEIRETLISIENSCQDY